MSKIRGWLILITISVSNVVSTRAQADLSFASAVDLAQHNAAELSVLDANIDAARANALAAGRLPDPKLAVGIENLPATGDDQWRVSRDFMTMRRVGVMQEFPGYGKRQAQREVATAVVEQSQSERRAKVLIVRRAAATAWIERYYLEHRLTLLDELDHENQLFAAVVNAQLMSGKSKPVDILMPQQEAAELADRRDELQALLAKTTAELRRWVGEVADHPLVGDLPGFNIDAAQLREHVHAHPELAVYKPMMQVAQAELHEAQADKHPDWGVELFYSKRAAAYGDMVSLQFTVGLPIFSAHRQEPLISAKRQLVQRVMAEREQMFREHLQEFENDIAEYQNLSHQSTRIAEVKIPLAKQKVELQFAAYQAGRVELAELIAARRELIEEKFKLLQVGSMRTISMAKLYFMTEEGLQ